MNIFYLSSNLNKCVEYHCDKHLVKQILETAQLLSTAHHILESRFAKKVYKPTHINHPCSVWVRSSSDNYEWTYKFFCKLCEEYIFRYDRVHACEKLKKFLKNNPCKRGKITKRPQCMPEEYKDKNIVKAYRNYYLGEKMEFAAWKNKIPHWVKI
ncbi:MAG: pyrimidine dimer DNA glycosylase/endonuclease V [Candidatus Pacearchaeota archaeon]|nr:pyrimidine dimer DNA glycosylase/endonuclease V [Candidatus Pacearchaeota archaeon]